jgi:hypothetical protein
MEALPLLSVVVWWFVGAVMERSLTNECVSLPPHPHPHPHPHPLHAGDWRLETGDWRLETGDWRLETGDWRLETGDWRLENACEVSENRRPHTMTIGSSTWTLVLIAKRQRTKRQ